MVTKFTTSRFHVKYGPQSLFDRIQFKLKDVQTLKENSTHYLQRVTERNIPDEVKSRLKNFNTNEWELVMAEVRNDTFKFVNTTWETIYDGESYWVVFGFNETILTIFKSSGDENRAAIREGSIYDNVDRVNKELIDNELKYNLYQNSNAKRRN